MGVNAADPPMRSGELARRAGVSTDTLRHYERKGLLLPRRSPNGYRAYPPAALVRVRLIRRALSVGFTLDELARILRVRDRGGAPCHEVRALAAAKLETTKAQIRDLFALRDELTSLLEEWDARLARTPKGEPARLLDHWSERTAASPAERPRRARSWSRHRRKPPRSTREERT